MEVEAWQLAIGVTGMMAAVAGFCWTIVRYLLDATERARSERMQQMEDVHRRIDGVSDNSVRRDDFNAFASRMDVDLRGLRREHIEGIAALRADFQRYHDALLAHLPRGNDRGDRS